jgi:hypothetical protein
VRKCILTRSAPDVVDLPNGFYLGENYSNPFSPVTTIEFGLPEPSDVRLTIYNMLGRRVKVLVDERRDVVLLRTGDGSSSVGAYST